jgi:hypothetical protein
VIYSNNPMPESKSFQNCRRVREASRSVAPPRFAEIRLSLPLESSAPMKRKSLFRRVLFALKRTG